MKHLAVLAVFLVGVVAVVAIVRSRSGLPAQFSYHGRDYIDPSGCTKPYARDLPLRRVGSVRSEPIYLPHSMPRGLDPTYLYVRSGCLRAYDLSGGP